MRLVRIFSALQLAAVAAFAQVSETVNVHLVEVPVTVVDRGGNPVRGLTAANFALIDQGTRREITNFETIDFAQRENERGVSPLNPAARRSFLLLFDLSFSSPVARTKSQEAARNFIARGLQRRDLAAVATIDVDHGFRLLTSFTTDRNLLAAAIASPQTFVSGDPLRIAGSTVFDGPVSDASDAMKAANANADAVAEHTADVARLEKRLNDSYNRGRVERQLDLLSDLGRTLRMLPGRKQVVFFSEGFDARLVQGRDARAVAESMDDMQQTTAGAVWRLDPDAQYGSTNTMSILRGMSLALRGSDVVLHAVDIQGVRVQNDASGRRINSNESLFLVSNSTGGEVFKNSNDLTADLQQMLRRQEVVYVLGFRAPSARPGTFHGLTVKLKDVPGARAFHRAGYYETGSESQLERSLNTAEIVLNDIAQTDVRVSVLAAPIPTAGGNATVPVIVDINGDDVLRAAAQSSDVTAEVFVYAFDDEGIVRDRMFQRLTIDVAKQRERLRGGIKYVTTLSLTPGRYAIKSLVRVGQSEKKGYARTDVDVPATYDVAVLPPLFLDQPGRALLVRGGSHDPAAAFPFYLDGEPFLPAATAAVTGSAARRYVVFVYNAAADEIDLDTAVVDAMGKRRNVTPSLLSRVQGESVTKLVYEIANAGLDAGPARLDVVVHKKGSADARTASVPLMIER